MIFPKHVRDALLSYGFDEKEAGIYLAGLSLGSATVLELARRTELARTTIYPIIENLRHRGFFRMRKEKGHTHYVAEPPGTFLRRLEEREKTFRDILPSLDSLHGTVKDTVGVTMYEGSEGFRYFWQKLFHSGIKDYCLLTSATGMREYVREEYLVKNVIAERMRLGIRSRQLLPENAATRKIVSKDKDELRESRFLSQSAELPATILVFGDEAAFVTTRRENSIILVASGDIAVTLRTTFELLWKCAKPTEQA